ncbi:MAG: hypothetical protein IT242_07245 [Bacteroidia bacterium]|nr:hypothetical protein [Bacteroidia bacterium]
MSTREMQHFIYQNGLVTFIDGKSDEGMIVSRYNIPEARIEYYFIPSVNVLAYQGARASHDMNAHKNLGSRLDISSIIHVQTFN